MLRYDTASAIEQGTRVYQEDSLLCDFRQGCPVGFAVVADGMGGHAAGDIASRIATDTAFELLRPLRSATHDVASTPGHLREMLEKANGKIRDHSVADESTNGMGTTFVAIVIEGDLLHWISVGDSPLYLYRSGVLRQVNEDHSLAPQIDLLVTSGLMSLSDGRDHPDRNVLTSVLVGRDIPKVDCPSVPLGLLPGDVLVIASDGVQSLDHAKIESAMRECQNESSSVIASRLLGELRALNDPDQDNASFVVVRIEKDLPFKRKDSSRRPKVKEASSSVVTFLKSHFYFKQRLPSSAR